MYIPTGKSRILYELTLWKLKYSSCHGNQVYNIIHVIMVIIVHNNHNHNMVLQLEQELDMILDKKDVLKSAQQHWTVWVQAILQYADSCTGKLATAVQQAKSDYEGVCTSIIIL